MYFQKSKKEIEESTGANRNTIKLHLRKLATNNYLAQVGKGRDDRGHLDLGNVYIEQGQYEKAAEAYRESQRLASDNSSTYGNLVNSLLALQRLDEARQTIQQAQERKLDYFVLHSALYALAFFRDDSSAMADQQQWFAGKPEENIGVSLASDTEAYAGHLGKARELTRRAVDSAIRADSKESGAVWQAIAAQREAAYGNNAQARLLAAEALKLAPVFSGKRLFRSCASDSACTASPTTAKASAASTSTL